MESALIVTGVPDQVVSGGVAAHYDELVVRRLAGPYYTLESGPDPGADWFKRARIEECLIWRPVGRPIRRMVLDSYLIWPTEVDIFARAIKISHCRFCGEDYVICGDSVEVEDCFVEGICLDTLQCSYARCSFVGDVYCKSITLSDDDIPFGEYWFRDCVFVGATLVVRCHATLELAGCCWDQLAVRRRPDCDVALRVDGRAVGTAEAGRYRITLC